MIYEFQQPRFTEGVLAKSLQGRSPEEFYRYGVKSAKNMIPLLEGPMTKRPGTTYVAQTPYAGSRLFPFYKGGEEAYVVEIGYDPPTGQTESTRARNANSGIGTNVLYHSNTADLYVGMHLSGYGIDGDTTGYPTSGIEYGSVITAITASSVTISNPITRDLTGNSSITYHYQPSIRIYSQDKLLNVQGTTTPYKIYSHWWIQNNTVDEISTLNASQSGDVLFITCPTKRPFLLARTLEPTNPLRAEDDSVWTISEYYAEDGPYQSVNADNNKSFLISGTTVEEDIGAITFDVSNNFVIAANHGLQTGQKINLHVNDITSDVTGNTQIIIKNGTVDPTITTPVVASNDSGQLLFTTTKTHGLLVDDVVSFSNSSGSSMPGGVTVGTEYFIHTSGYTTFKIKATSSGSEMSYSSAGADVVFGTNKATTPTAYRDGDKLLGDAGNSFSSNSGKDNHFFFVYSTSAAIQISDEPNSKSFDMGYRNMDSSTPPTAGVQFSGKCTLKRVKYLKGSTVTIVSRMNTDGAGTWQNASAANEGQLFTSADIGRMIRLNPLADPTTRKGGIRWGWGKITEITNDYTCKVKLETDLSPNPDTTNGTPEWRLGAFSGFLNYTTGVFTGQGYPKLSQIYQQRFVFAAPSFEPSTIWASRSGNYYNFAPTELSLQDTPIITGGITSEVITDSNGLTFTIDSDTLDEIMWLMDSKKLAIGTSAGVYMLYGTETNLSVTPSRFTVSRETSYSASTIQPVIVSNVLIYPQLGGREVQELEFSGAEDQWLQSRISMKAYDMISTSSIIKMAWQERPNPIIWMLMDDGRALSLSYDRSVQFKAWSEHTFGGTYQGGIAKVVDIAVIPRNDYDQVWLKIRRTIDGADVDYVERMERYPSENKITRNELVYLDSAKMHKASEQITYGTGKTAVKVDGGSQALNAQLTTKDGVTTPAVGLRFKIPGNDTIYSVIAGSSPTTWKLDQNLQATPANNAELDLRLEELTIDHLEGETVGLCTNGMEHTERTVDGNKKITLSHTLATTAISGFPYTSQIETLSPPTPDNQYTFNKKLLTLTALIQDSLGIELEFNETTEELLFRSTQQNTGEPIDFFNGIKKTSLSGIGYSTHNVIVRSISPLPMQINALSVEVETGGA